MIKMNNQLSRREFFKILLGAMATGTLLTSPALADALEQISPDSPDSKYAVVIKKAKEVAGLMKPYEDNSVSDFRLIGEKMQDVFVYIKNNFDFSGSVFQEAHSFLWKGYYKKSGILELDDNAAEKELERLGESLTFLSITNEFSHFRRTMYFCATIHTLRDEVEDIKRDYEKVWCKGSSVWLKYNDIPIYDEAGPQPSSVSADLPRLEKNRTLREPEINSNAVYPMTQNGRNLFVMH
jgi:hypothetical protein